MPFIKPQFKYGQELFSEHATAMKHYCRTVFVMRRHATRNDTQSSAHFIAEGNRCRQWGKRYTFLQQLKICTILDKHKYRFVQTGRLTLDDKCLEMADNAKVRPVA